MMAKQTVGAGDCQTFKAARDLSSYQFCPVGLSAADTVDYVAAHGKVIGILLNKPDAAGKAATVCTASGVLCKCKVAGSAVAFGDTLEAEGTTDYRAAEFSINMAGANVTYLIGYGNETSAAAGGIVTILTCFSPAAYT